MELLGTVIAYFILGILGFVALNIIIILGAAIYGIVDERRSK